MTNIFEEIFGGGSFPKMSPETVKKITEGAVTFKTTPHDIGGWNITVTYPNGYGADIACHAFSYGGDKGLKELAVLKDGELVYDTPITDDVLGYLEDDEVVETCRAIARL